MSYIMSFKSNDVIINKREFDKISHRIASEAPEINENSDLADNLH